MNALNDLRDEVALELLGTMTQRQLELRALSDAIERYCWLSDEEGIRELTEDEVDAMEACAKHIAREYSSLIPCKGALQ